MGRAGIDVIGRLLAQLDGADAVPSGPPSGRAECVAVARTPVPTKQVPPVPAFIADRAWRGFLPPGRTLVPVPLPSFSEMAGMRWAATARLGSRSRRGI